MQAFSILWPIKNIEAGELVERNFLHNISEEKQRSSRLSIWYKLPRPFYDKAFTKFNTQMLEGSKNSAKVLV